VEKLKTREGTSLSKGKKTIPGWIALKSETKKVNRKGKDLRNKEGRNQQGEDQSQSLEEN